MSLTREDVEDILRVLDGTDVGELELSTSRFRLVLRRDGDGWTQRSEVRAAPDLVASGTPADATDEAAADVAPPDRSPTGEGLVEVRAPLMGTFYRAPKPGAAPFVELGSQVQPDTVVALIETMKLFTSVYAGVDGRVAEICLEDGTFTDQDAVVLRIAPEPE